MAVASVGELVDLIDHPYAHEEAPPLIVADLATTPPRADPTVTGGWVNGLRSLPSVSVGVIASELPGAAIELAEGFDILVACGSGDSPAAVAVEAVDDAVARLDSAVGASPQAARAAAALLRLGPWIETAAGLWAESAAYSVLQSGRQFRQWLETIDRPATADRGPRVTAERTAGVLRVTFDRPDRHNAFDAATRDELVDLLRMAATDPTLDGLILAGNGPSFCAGGDLAEFGTTPDPLTAHEIRVQRSAAYWIDRLAGRVRVHLHGACVGAGIELAAFAGSVLATPDTFVQLPEVGFGLVPGAGGTVSIPRRIGRQRTCWLALTGERLDAETARAWGLIDRVVAGFSPEP